MKLYRFKSNPATIVKRFGPNLVRIVWSKSHEYGDTSSFSYRYDPENLIELTEQECNEIKQKRKAIGL